jgi:hypothetical protein
MLVFDKLSFMQPISNVQTEPVYLIEHQNFQEELRNEQIKNLSKAIFLALATTFYALAGTAVLNAKWKGLNDATPLVSFLSVITSLSVIFCTLMLEVCYDGCHRLGDNCDVRDDMANNSGDPLPINDDNSSSGLTLSKRRVRSSSCKSWHSMFNVAFTGICALVAAAPFFITKNFQKNLIWFDVVNLVVQIALPVLLVTDSKVFNKTTPPPVCFNHDFS